MARLLPILAAGFIAVPIAGPPALAQSATMRAEFAAPLERAEKIIISGRSWDCSGSACVSRGIDARPAIACRKLSRKIGQPAASFISGGEPLGAADLASCNQDQK